MAKPRETLQALLEAVLGSRNVYFQPPESLKLKYPCIVYELSGIRPLHADNQEYVAYKRYSITYINEDPDSLTVDELEVLPFCTLDRTFKADNLNHYVFTIFY